MAHNADYERLIERLRKRGRDVCVESVPLIPQENKYEWRPDELCSEAADAIEALLQRDGTGVPDG